MGEGGYKQINKALDVRAFDTFLAAQHAALPELPNVQQLTPRVLRVLGQNPGKFTLQGTNTYIIGTGKRRIIVDTAQGFREWADLIASTLEDGGFELSHVLLSHHHGDHIKGVPDLLDLYPHLTNAVYKYDPEQGQQPIHHGQRFHVEGATLRAVHATGHAHDHMCFILEEENAMFTGDNVLGHGTTAVENLGLFMQMLEDLGKEACTTGYPAHGDVIGDLQAKIESELTTKRRREMQCLQVLAGKGQSKSPGMTVPEIVMAIHGNNVSSQTREAALEPFTDEVLRKLAADGKVVFRMSGGQRRWFTPGRR